MQDIHSDFLGLKMNCLFISLRIQLFSDEFLIDNQHHFKTLFDISIYISRIQQWNIRARDLSPQRLVVLYKCKPFLGRQTLQPLSASNNYMISKISSRCIRVRWCVWIRYYYSRETKCQEIPKLTRT